MYKYIENVRKDLLNVFFLVSKNRNVRSACFTNSSLILFSHCSFLIDEDVNDPNCDSPVSHPPSGDVELRLPLGTAQSRHKTFKLYT